MCDIQAWEPNRFMAYHLSGATELVISAFGIANHNPVVSKGLCAFKDRRDSRTRRIN